MDAFVLAAVVLGVITCGVAAVVAVVFLARPNR